MTEPNRRLLSVDLARGLTMFMMVMIDNQGAFSDVWWIFNESDWVGLTTADCIFPTFLFIAGLSVTLALSKERYEGVGKNRPGESETRELCEQDEQCNLRSDPLTLLRRAWRTTSHRSRVGLKIIWRAVKLFVIGALLNLWAADFNGSRWVYLGVLQRIALCYSVISLLFVYTPTWAIRVFAANCGLVYVSIMHSVHVPSCSGIGSFSASCNAASYIDRTALGTGHVFSSGVLPEGLVSTLTAFVTTYIGFEFGLLLQRYKREPEKLAVIWFSLSFCFAIVGRLLGLWEPVVKKLWTLSFTFLAAAVSGLLMSACVAFADLSWEGVWSALPFTSRLHVKGTPPGSSPASSKWLLAEAPMLTGWIWLGRNPAVVFIGMVALEILLLDSIKVSCDATEASCNDGNISAWASIFNRVFASWITNTAFASTLFALVHFALWLGIAGVLFRLRVFVTM